MKQTLLAIALLSIVSCKAQDTEQQINKDVWMPFIETYESFDADGFMAIHTEDVVRVNRDGGIISVGETYARSRHETSARLTELNAHLRIDFSFVQRLHTEDVGYEVGYYRVTSAYGGQERVSYGKFHVLLRKVNGQWKIAVDSDTSNGGSVQEEDFMKGKVLER